MGYLFPVLAVLTLSSLFAVQPFIHIFQLESYKRPQFFLRLQEDRALVRALAAKWAVILLIQVICVAVVLVLYMSGMVGRGVDNAIDSKAVLLAVSCMASAVFAIALALGFFAWKRQPSKKPLKYTSRVFRLQVSLSVVLLVLACVWAGLIQWGAGAGFWLAFAQSDIRPVVLAAALYLLLAALQGICLVLLPRLLALASVLVQPVETAVKNWYFNDARKKLAGFGSMVRIGITGSYGKTSAKVILATILSEKFKTYATPHSYNTPMGVTKAIREQLDESVQVFIAEMGARHVGDIAEMCRLVAPQYGLLTSIGPQHLETFFTLDNVAKTKYELIEALPPDGRGFFPCDNEICLNLYRQTAKPKALFGFEGCGEALYMSASDIAHGPQGSTFVLTGPDGAFVKCTTRLLGKHNVQNILGCAAVAHALGLTMEEIARGIARVEPVEHRLQLIPTGNGITVIDDAFNSNPAGARAALEVLKDFPGRRVIVTPGLVELGDAEAAENEAFGRAMAAAVNIAILVARNAGAIKKGLLEAGFDADNIIVTGRLAEATAALGALTQIGDVVLFENDLPDHYET